MLNTPDPSYHGAVWTQAVKPMGPVAYIINGSGTPLVKAEDDPKTSYLTPPRDALAQAEAGQVAISLPRNNNRVAAIVKLQRHPGQFLYVARGLSGNVLQHVRLAEQNVDDGINQRTVRHEQAIVIPLLGFEHREHSGQRD